MATAVLSRPGTMLSEILEQRILVLDGATGTMVQALKLDDQAMRGDRFQDHPKDLSRFVDILCLTQPDKVTEIHCKYLEAGADIIETNTFGASAIGMEEFALPGHLVQEINAAAVHCARQAADRPEPADLDLARVAADVVLDAAEVLVEAVRVPERVEDVGRQVDVPPVHGQPNELPLHLQSVLDAHLPGELATA